MAQRRDSPRHIKLHRSYTVEEIASALGVHKNSVRGWQRAGLQPIDDCRPIMFQGGALRSFLEQRRASRKRPCRPGTLYCFKCREPRPPALDMVDWVPITSTSGNLKAMCATCETVMHRRARLEALPSIMPRIAIQIPQGTSRLRGCSSPSVNCDLDKEA